MYVKTSTLVLESRGDAEAWTPVPSPSPDGRRGYVPAPKQEECGPSISNGFRPAERVVRGRPLPRSVDDVDRSLRDTGRPKGLVSHRATRREPLHSKARVAPRDC